MSYINTKKTRELLAYWANAIPRYSLPGKVFSQNFQPLLDKLNDEEKEILQQRVAYYCRLDDNAANANFAERVGSLRVPFRSKHRHSRYVMDLKEILCHFPANYRFNYVFGDVTEVPPVPAFVKSRPVTQGCTNSVVMKLDKLRHFQFIRDTIPFQEKRDMIVSRNKVNKDSQPHRKQFLELYASHPMCDVGKINIEENEPNPNWVKSFMSKEQQLQYKFISCIEGNDVATNLKWVMSSNSLAVMPKPRYETWYMEGVLVPGVHYVEIKPDYSDLIEKMEYYIAHPQEAQTIIDAAHKYTRQFIDKRLELAVQWATAEAYFKATGQIQ